MEEKLYTQKTKVTLSITFDCITEGLTKEELTQTESDDVIWDYFCSHLEDLYSAVKIKKNKSEHIEE